MQRHPRPLVTAPAVPRRSALVLAGRIEALRRRLHAHAPPGTAAGRRLAMLPPMERVMRRLAHAAGPTLVTHLHVHPSWSTAVRWTLQQFHVQRAATHAHLTPAPREVLRERLLQQRHLVRERVERRDAVRIAQLTLHAPPVTRIEQRQVFPRVQLTLVRRAAAAMSPAQVREPAAAEASVRTAARNHPAAAARDPAQPALAPQDLARVTDHVLHALDRRALSWHERTGRI